MRKPLTAEMLLNQLLEMKSLNYDLSRIELSFGYDSNCEHESITYTYISDDCE